jgi:hypothetical protein
MDVQLPASIERVRTIVREHKAMADSYNIALVAYEAGFHG